MSVYVIVGPITRLFHFLRIILCSRWPVRKGSTKEWSVKEMIDWGENKRTKKLLVSQVAQSVHCSTFIKLKICEDGWDICGLDKELCKSRNPRNCFEHSSGFASSDSSDFFYFFFKPPHCHWVLMQGQQKALKRFNSFLMVPAKNPLHKSARRRNF